MKILSGVAPCRIGIPSVTAAALSLLLETSIEH